MKQNFEAVPDCLKIGEWNFYVSAHELVRNSETIRLEPRVASLLLYLASRAGETVSRESLLEALWPGVVVSDEALTNAVNKLRRAFEDDRANPHVIETIPKTGYRLIASVESPLPSPKQGDTRTDTPRKTDVTDPAVSRDQGSAAPTIVNKPRRRAMLSGGILILGLLLGIGFHYLSKEPDDDQVQSEAEPSSILSKPSIAVLPLINLSDDPQQDYFIDGITEDLITDLSKLSGLDVIARNSVFSYKGLTPKPQEVAKQLGASYVLEGSVRNKAGRVRINVKLIDTSTGFNIWADRFDGKLDDVFALQDNLARKIASALAVQLTEQEQILLAKDPTSDVEALMHYFMGSAYFGSATKQENDLSRQMYLRAIALDPDYAQAYAALALTYIDDQRRGWSSDPEESVNQARKLAQQAISINDTIPQAHFVLGYIYLYANSQHDLATEAAKKAIELDPNYPDGYTLLSSAYFFSGYPEKALPLDRKAMRLNPASSFLYYMHLGRSHYIQGRYAEASEALQEAAERNNNFIPNRLWLAATYGQMGKLDDAEWEIDQVLTLNPEFSLDNWLETRPYKNPLYKEQLLNGLQKAGITIDINN